MKISPSVRAAMVPDDNPMHPDYTSIYLVGPKGKQSLTIDSGEEIDRYRWFLKGYLAAIENEELGIAAITHHHIIGRPRRKSVPSPTSFATVNGVQAARCA